MNKELDPLEIRCLAMAARGLSRSEIICQTDVPHDRIEAAFVQAMEKLQAQNLAEAIFRAARMNLI
ncbi:transcriptional regulator [Pararhizobium sp.]|uniref:transcriptional regulator n=1 Tax=Pararhizobium sp. TaxID=1977563 RepID=UPI00272344B1|nr:transcriptional regulator [Pararhizobium sp.]MDO9415135.1 transcriptional regulator [Pararhizobium sp.]